MTHNDALALALGPELFNQLEWTSLKPTQREAILSVFRVGIGAGAQSGVVSTIDRVLGRGRVLVCEDGSRWEACADDDAELIEDWGEGALVAVHRQLMYRLDPYQAAEVDILRL
jgi:ferric-dicitrate binding protein FerR (iron transport regulator)